MKISVESLIAAGIGFLLGATLIISETKPETKPEEQLKVIEIPTPIDASELGTSNKEVAETRHTPKKQQTPGPRRRHEEEIVTVRNSAGLLLAHAGSWFGRDNEAWIKCGGRVFIRAFDKAHNCSECKKEGNEFAACIFNDIYLCRECFPW